MKTYILIIGLSTGTFFKNCIAQSPGSTDSIQISDYKTPEEKLELLSGWLRAVIISEDSIINLMATRADKELKGQTNVRYVKFIVSSLLDTQRDTALHVIANNLSVCPYINETSGIDMIYKRKTFPAVKAIETAHILQINILKDYLLSSDFLNNDLSIDEINILNYLLVNHDPAYGLKLNPAKYTGQALKNIQSILDWKEK